MKKVHLGFAIGALSLLETVLSPSLNLFPIAYAQHQMPSPRSSTSGQG
jgi:hypothetical protein